MTETNLILAKSTITGLEERVPAEWLDLFPSLVVVSEKESATPVAEEIVEAPKEKSAK